MRGETVAAEHTERLAIQSIASARNSMLLSLAHGGSVGHIPCALAARDGESVVDLERAAEDHEQATHAHITAASLDERLMIGPHSRKTPPQRR